MNLRSLNRLVTRVSAALLLTAAAAVPASAQTLRLTDSNATVLRGGTYANTNLASETLLATRASSDYTYVRRIVLKFDTQTPIPQNTSIASATLTLTVAGGNAESRTLALYRVANSFEEAQSTWNRRNTSTTWSRAGGDLAEKWTSQTVTSSVGSQVTFNVTSLVQAAVNGNFGSSRYTRVALVDSGASSKESYKEYYSDEAGDITVRPTLTVTLGAASAPIVEPAPEPAPTPAPTPAPAPAPTTGTSLRVLTWNLHHGVGTDGVYNIDRIATWMAKMTPDVIMSNEVEKYTGWGNEDQPARYKAMMEAKTGRKWYMHFAQEFGDWTSKGKGHLILSVYPIESFANAELTPSSGLNGAGAVTQARITVNGRTITLVLTHLDPSSTTMRLTQAKETLNFAVNFPENRILAGDMNAWPDQTSIAELNKTYYDSWTMAEKIGKATGISGITPFGATKKGRIDYIFYSKGASNLVVKDSKTWDTRSSSGVMPSDHRPVVTTFEVR